MTDDGRVWLLGVAAVVGAAAITRAPRPERGSSVRPGRRLQAPRRDRDGPPVLRKMLVLSTAHLPKGEADRLELLFDERLASEFPEIAARQAATKSSKERPFTVLSFRIDYGWIVYAALEDETFEVMADEDRMPVLARILRHAYRAFDATYVQFDSDASTLAGLDVFDW